MRPPRATASAPALLGTGDLRGTDAWTPRQRLKNDALWAVACAALWALRRAPPSAARGAGRVMAALTYVLAHSARRTTLANLARVYPSWSPRRRAALAHQTFATLGALLGESARELAGAGPTMTLPVTDSALATLREARARGRGVVFASAHLGPWERVASALAAAGIPLFALARESYDPRFSRLFEHLRARSGVRMMWRGEPSTPWKIVRCLRRGEVLAVPMDLRTRGVPSCESLFLGHPAPTPVGPARIALRVGAPVVVGTVAPLSAASMAVTATAIPTDDLRDDDAGVSELTARINAELSRRILALPHAWVWMHDRWTAAPAV